VNGRRLYVYYRVPRRDEAAIVKAMRALQQQWQTVHRGLQCDLLRRDDDSAADEVTLMETYRAAEGVSPSWQARIEAETGELLASWPCSARHVEVFVPCTAP
jgi:Domain of unknown function (DUF4936)